MRRFKPFGREIPKEQVMAVLARIDEGIVRCKECKHWDYEASGCKCISSTVAWRDDDFCSYGEAREEIQGLEYAENILENILREQEEGAE